MLLDCIAEGCEGVVNLAAGLDTRPYRMRLPAAFRWIEVDLPEILEEKAGLLAGEKPVCQLARRPVDLSDATARSRLLNELEAQSDSLLVITEGLLLYLDEAVVASLARELAACRSVHWWIFDLASPGLLSLMRRSMGTRLANAPMKFGPVDGVAYFEAFGWRTRAVRSMLQEARRMKRLSGMMKLFAMLPPPDARRLGRHARWSGVVRLAKG